MNKDIANKESFWSKPLLSALLVIILNFLVNIFIMISYANNKDWSYIYYRIKLAGFNPIINGCWLACLVIIGWYAVMQKYKRTYSPYHYVLMPIVVVFINYMFNIFLDGRLSFIVIFKDPNSLQFIFTLFVISLILHGYFILTIKQLSRINKVKVTLLTILLLITVAYSYYLPRPTDVEQLYSSYSYLLGIRTVLITLLVCAIFLILGDKIGRASDEIPSLSIYQLGLILALGVIYFDLSLFRQQKMFVSYEESLRLWMIIIFLCIKALILYGVIKTRDLQTKPLYIIWAILAAVIFSKTLIVGVNFLFVWFANLYLSSVRYAEARGAVSLYIGLFWYAFGQFMVYALLNLSLTSYFFKVFFPKKEAINLAE